jgi:hypothetical protein
MTDVLLEIKLCQENDLDNQENEGLEGSKNLIT